MKKLKRTWTALPQKDRMRWLVVGTAAVVGLYGLTVFPFTAKAHTKSEAMLARRIDRLEKRAAVPDVDAAAASMLQGKATKLERQKAELEARLAAIAGRFLERDDVEARQMLLLELNSLADATGVRLDKQGDEVGRDGARALIDRESGRPYMRVLGSGTYWALMDFLRGIENLDFATAPLGLELELSGGERLTIKIDMTL